MIVDGHAHVFTERPAGWRAPPPGQPWAALAEDYLTVMDRAGVDRAVLVGITPDEEYLKKCLRRHPDRFALIDVHEPAAGPEQAWRAAVQGFRGIRVFDLEPTASTSTGTVDTLRAMRDHRLVLWLFPRSDQLDRWVDILGRFPDLPVVLNHLGRCSDVDGGGRRRFTDRIWRFAELPNVVVMVSSLYEFSRMQYPYLDLRDVMATAYRCFGPSRMLWASNYPLVLKDPTGYAAQLDLPTLHLPDLSPDDRAAILGTTARRLMGW